MLQLGRIGSSGQEQRGGFKLSSRNTTVPNTMRASNNNAKNESLGIEVMGDGQGRATLVYDYHSSMQQQQQQSHTMTAKISAQLIGQRV